MTVNPLVAARTDDLKGSSRARMGNRKRIERFIAEGPGASRLHSGTLTMASLILVKPGREWTASGGLFDFTLEFLIPRLSDRKAAASLRTAVDNNLGSVWLTGFSPTAQEEIFELLRTGLIAEAGRVLPESPAKKPALDLLQQLVDLTTAAPAE